MSLLRLVNGYDRKSDAKLLAIANFIHQEMSGNPNFPSPTPTMTEFATAIASFKSAVIAAGSGSRVHIALKRRERTALVDTLHLLGYYVLYASGGSRIKAISSGMSLAKDPSAVVLTKPTGLLVQNSNQTGVLLVSVQKAAGAVSYYIQYTTDAELKEEAWRSMNSSTIKCKLEGLQPGTVYYIRVGAIGRKEQVLYSDVVSRMAV